MNFIKCEDCGTILLTESELIEICFKCNSDNLRLLEKEVSDFFSPHFCNFKDVYHTTISC